MISINNVSKFYGKKTLFENVSFTINEGETIGLIGPNGAGKSTLFRMILGETEPTSGSLHINKNIRIGYLPQESSFSSAHTVLQEIVEGDPAILQLKKEKDSLERDHQSHSHRYAEILHELEVLGYFELEHKGKAILSGLGFKEKDFTRPIVELSGGWQMRVLLAKLLTCNYDFLMLDEPTNYLDLNAALWLKDFLSHYRGAFVIISHDKAFLNEVTQLSFILEHGTIARIKGNYEQYQKIRQEQRGYLVKQFREQEKIREQYQRFIDRFHAQPNKASQVRAKRKMLERMPEIVVPQDPRESIGAFKFPVTKASGYRVARLEKIHKSYPGIEVYNNFDFEITKGEKAVLVGENGAGKSTLLKILAGVTEINSGSRVIGHNVSIGYFSQTRMDVLTPERTVLEEAYGAVGGSLSIEAIRTMLAIFLFTGDDVEKRVSVLSGGEKSRLILAKLLLDPPNFLLLDEPTTHLDVDAVDALIKALTEYQGTIVSISHDIHFVRSVANAVFEVKGGAVTKFPGNFDYYLHKKAQDAQRKPACESASVSVDPAACVAPVVQETAGTLEAQKDFRKAQLSKQIKKLRKQKDKLELERNAKMRILENPRHGEDIIRYYTLLVEELDKRIAVIEHEIIELKARFL